MLGEGMCYDYQCAAIAANKISSESPLEAIPMSSYQPKQSPQPWSASSLTNFPFLCRGHTAMLTTALILSYFLPNLGSSLIAATKTISSSAASNAVWGTSTTWTPAGIPGTGDDVVFDLSLSTSVASMALHSVTTGTANSLTFGSGSGTPLPAFTFRTSNSGTSSRSLTLSTGAITVASQVTGTQSILSSNGSASNITMTLNATDGSFEISNNSSQLLTMSAVLGNGTAGTTVTLGGTGTGGITLSGANTYSGETTINAGTLTLTSGGTINSSAAVNVRSGATFDFSAKTSGYSVNGLSGSGTVNGRASQPTTVVNTLAAGDGGIGTLTLSAGNLTLSSGATLSYEIGGTTASPLSDLINLTGASSTVSLAGSYTLSLSDLSGGVLDPTGKTFVLFDSVANITSPGSWTLAYGSTSWTGGTVGLVGGNLVLSNLTVIPEPSSSALIVLGGIGLLLGIQRRRSLQASCY